jgi:hypothetical protein
MALRASSMSVVSLTISLKRANAMVDIQEIGADFLPRHPPLHADRPSGGHRYQALGRLSKFHFVGAPALPNTYEGTACSCRQLSAKILDVNGRG